MTASLNTLDRILEVPVWKEKHKDKTICPKYISCSLMNRMSHLSTKAMIYVMGLLNDQLSWCAATK